jgi:uncharacterized protein (DUF58 family)
MLGSLKARILLAAVAVGLMALLAAPTAMATSSCGTQNPDLTVCVSVSPDQATNGDTVTATACVTNNTDVTRRVLIAATLTTPSGESYPYRIRTRIGPGETVCRTETFTVQPYFPRGTYTLTVSATDRNGTSSASGSVTLV